MAPHVGFSFLMMDGIQALALGVQNLSHWITREILHSASFYLSIFLLFNFLFVCLLLCLLLK